MFDFVVFCACSVVVLGIGCAVFCAFCSYVYVRVHDLCVCICVVLTPPPFLSPLRLCLKQVPPPPVVLCPLFSSTTRARHHKNPSTIVCLFFSKLIHDWKRAVQRSLGWHVEEGQSPHNVPDQNGAGDGTATLSPKNACSLLSGRCPAISGSWWLGAAATVAVAVAVSVAVALPVVARQGGRRSTLGPR